MSGCTSAVPSRDRESFGWKTAACAAPPVLLLSRLAPFDPQPSLLIVRIRLLKNARRYLFKAQANVNLLR